LPAARHYTLRIHNQIAVTEYMVGGSATPAALRLARFLAAAGRKEGARELLAPLYPGLNEGRDNADMLDAGNLLSLE
jgi:hypothetical protein